MISCSERKLVTLAGLLMSLLGSQADALDWKVQTVAGQKVVAHGYCTVINLSSCTEGPLPTIDIKKQPIGGTLEFGNTSDIVRFIRKGEKRVSAGRCTGMKDHCVTILYTPRSDFHGPDEITYTVRHPNQSEDWNDTVAIDVR
jgi:hypothetical protein